MEFHKAVKERGEPRGAVTGRGEFHRAVERQGEPPRAVPGWGEFCRVIAGRAGVHGVVGRNLTEQSQGRGSFPEQWWAGGIL